MYNLPWPWVTKQHSISVSACLDDPQFNQYDNAQQRLLYLRRRHEGILMMIRTASAFQFYYLFLKANKQFSWQITSRVVTFLVISDTLNWHLYYQESKEIVNVYNHLLKEIQDKIDRERD